MKGGGIIKNVPTILFVIWAVFGSFYFFGLDGDQPGLFAILTFVPAILLVAMILYWIWPVSWSQESSPPSEEEEPEVTEPQPIVIDDDTNLNIDLADLE